MGDRLTSEAARWQPLRWSPRQQSPMHAAKAKATRRSPARNSASCCSRRKQWGPPQSVQQASGRAAGAIAPRREISRQEATARNLGRPDTLTLGRGGDAMRAGARARRRKEARSAWSSELSMNWHASELSYISTMYLMATSSEPRVPPSVPAELKTCHGPEFRHVG